MELEEKKQRILELIDRGDREGPKIAFYSDPRVANLIEQLYSRWEENEKKGIPLDYATKEEIDYLYNIAMKYSNISDAEAWALFMRREDAHLNPTLQVEEEVVEEKKSIWRRVFWFLFPG